MFGRWLMPSHGKAGARLTAALLPLGDSGVHPTPSFLPLPHKGIASENLSGLLSLFGENKKGGKEALYMRLRVCVCPHTHILNKVISVTDTICLGPPDFRVGCGSWGLRKPGLCRKKTTMGRRRGPIHLALETLPFLSP